jgi:hypothetical protein
MQHGLHLPDIGTAHPEIGKQHDHQRMVLLGPSLGRAILPGTPSSSVNLSHPDLARMPEPGISRRGRGSG